MPQTIPIPRFHKMSERAKKTLRDAEQIARFQNSPTIEPIHLLSALYFERAGVGSAFLKKLGFRDDDFVTPILAKDLPDTQPPTENVPELSESVKKIIIKSYVFAESAKSPYVGTEHLTHSLLRSKDPKIEQMLLAVGKRSTNTTPTLTGELPLPTNELPFSHFLNLPEFNMLHRGTDSEDDSALEHFCIDLRDRVSSTGNDPHIGRAQELEKLIHILGRKKKNNALLLGDPGVGKTALVSGLMRRILEGAVPESLRDTVIYELDMASVVAGTSFRGEFEERLKSIIEEASGDPRVLLFIDEIHTIVGAGNGSGALDAANILKPALANGTLRCIGATTLSEFKKHFEKDAALSRRFQSIVIEQPSAKETETILLGTLPSFEAFHNVRIEPSAIKTAVQLSARYIPERSFPDKALDILDSACSIKRSGEPAGTLDLEIRSIEKKLDDLFEKKQEAISAEAYDTAEKLQNEESALLKKLKEIQEKKKKIGPKIFVTQEDIEYAVSQSTGIPLDTIRSTTHLRIQNLHTQLRKTVIGQEKAMEKITAVLMRSGVGLSRSNRPLGSFLLLGPTGVGKTLTAKTIAKHFFQKESAFIRIDMSEFRERHTLSGLLGAPAGYVGYGEGGTLTEKVRRNPYCLVLFDEVEKAHPDILNILLQILEEGFLSDAEGRKVSFTDTIVLLTANIGSSDLFTPSRLGFDTHRTNAFDEAAFRAIAQRLKKQLPEHIRPEILARLDEILILEPLTQNDLQKITQHELSSIKKTLAERKIIFSWDKFGVQFLAEKSFRKNEGARPVRKIVQTLVENHIAEILLKQLPPFALKMTFDDKKRTLTFVSKK